MDNEGVDKPRPTGWFARRQAKTDTKLARPLWAFLAHAAITPVVIVAMFGGGLLLGQELFPPQMTWDAARLPERPPMAEQRKLDRLMDRFYCSRAGLGEGVIPERRRFPTSAPAVGEDLS